MFARAKDFQKFVQPKLHWAVALTALLFCAKPVHAKNSQAPAVPDNPSLTGQSKLLSELSDLQKKSAARSAVEAQFQQNVYSALRKRVTTSKGTLKYSIPLFFRWEITSPRSELYVKNDKWFWKYVASAKHAMRMPATSSELDFLDVIFNFETLPEKYLVEKIDKISVAELELNMSCLEKLSCFKLTPKAQERHSNISVAIDRKTGLAKTIFIEFRNGNRTEISFSQYKKSQFGKRAFDFSPPPGTAIDKR